MQFNTLQQWLTWLEQEHASWELGLNRMNAVATELKLTQFHCPVITVAGTNGKGSTVHALNALYHHSGYRTGLYTSPHIQRFNERIMINNQEVEDAKLIEAFQTIYDKAGQANLTYFELTTAAALWLFQQAQLDVIILEVGLGGRLDAVNVVENDVAIITSVALDHTQWLGDTREIIGYEKAGIFKAGKTAIITDPEPPQSVLQHAQDKHMQCYRQGQDYGYSLAHSKMTWHGINTTLELPIPKLLPANIASVLLAAQCLQNRLPVDLNAMAKQLANFQITGRYQTIQTNPEIILDVAHNPQATENLANQLSQEKCSGQTIAICSMLKEKDHLASLQPMANIVQRWFLYPLQCHRAADVQHLKSTLESLKPVGAIEITANFADALTNSLSDCTWHDRIIIFGSFYTVQDALNFFANKKNQVSQNT